MLFSASSQSNVEDAIRTIRLIIKDAIENPEGQNDLRKTQLMELARLNGTLREGFEPKENSWLKPENQTITNQLVCTKCGGRGHISGDCRSGHTGKTNENLELHIYAYIFSPILGYENSTEKKLDLFLVV